MTSPDTRGSSDDGPARIVRAARERYRRGQRVELARLATEVGVGRATAYRWLGDNDRLLARVLAEQITHDFTTLRRAHAHTHGREKVLAIAEGMLRHATTSQSLQNLLRREHRRALKILATSDYDVQRTIIALFEDLLNGEQSTGHLHLTAPSQTLAYGIVCLIETHFYTDAITGTQHDIDTTLQLVGLLLPGYDGVK